MNYRKQQSNGQLKKPTVHSYFYIFIMNAKYQVDQKAQSRSFDRTKKVDFIKNFFG